MKNYLHYITPLSFLLLLTSFSVSAQEAGSPSFESYDIEHLRERDRVPSTPGESPDPQRPGASKEVKDSTATRMPQRNLSKPVVVPKDQSKPKDQTDDSLLSFNFLYYLIQKYKMQDILD
jgi:hypothetical protein